MRYFDLRKDVVPAGSGPLPRDKSAGQKGRPVIVVVVDDCVDQFVWERKAGGHKGTNSRYYGLALGTENSFYRALEKVNITLLVDLPRQHHKRLLFRVIQGESKHRLGLGDNSGNASLFCMAAEISEAKLEIKNINKAVEQRYVGPPGFRAVSRYTGAGTKLEEEGMNDVVDREWSCIPLVKSPGIWKVGKYSVGVAPTEPRPDRGVFDPECVDQNESYVNDEPDPKLYMSLAVRDI